MVDPALLGNDMDYCSSAIMGGSIAIIMATKIIPGEYISDLWQEHAVMV